MLAIAFNVIAGFNDGGNLLAAATASRTIRPGVAFVLISLGALAGPLVAGTAVAKTIGHGIVDYTHVGFVPLAGGLAGGIAVILLAYAIRLPTSASVALVSATIGALWARHQLQAIMWSGVGKVIFSLIGSIVVGFLAGAIVYVLAWVVYSRLSWTTGHRLMQLQYVTVFLQAIGYGSNDAEKMMGLIVAATLIGSPSAAFVVPLWVIAMSIAAFSIGMAFGGLRVARTIGGKIFRIRSGHALSFQLAAAATVIGASALGGPLSTTETTASAILGVGTAANPRALRWQTARDLVTTWLLTAPAGILLGGCSALLLHLLFQGV